MAQDKNHAYLHKLCVLTRFVRNLNGLTWLDAPLEVVH